MSSSHNIEWIDRGREPQCPPNPMYPNGIDVDPREYGLRADGPACKVNLPYPAKRCGVYMVECGVCGASVGVTTAGRPDDPRSVLVPCKELSQ